MASDRSLIEKDLSRGNRSAHAHLRKPANLLVVKLGIKFVGQFVTEFRFVHPDRLVPPKRCVSYLRRTSMIMRLNKLFEPFLEKLGPFVHDPLR
jgi:hypothetical protein